MKSWCHRENKGYSLSNRKMAQDYIARVVLGRTKVGEYFKLAHSSSRRSRRKRRKQFRQQHREELRPNDDMRRTIVAYGDASVRGTYKGNTPIPVKQVQKAIAEKAIVIPTDEFRTSVTCCHCHQRLVNVALLIYICNHRKKKHRSSFFWGNMIESRSTLKCYNEENHILHRTSQCPERRLTNNLFFIPYIITQLLTSLYSLGNRVIYPLKLCPQCPANNENRLHWNRDVNAATSIRTILVEYIRQGFNLESRPA
ncbi:MAG: hypothetical protein EXX96DRAFT_195520 [Benjaminiella poitrasii]|nr:MAG: hypothetical protein EXX96DRAFT_195520 [Benjaminiella poitrasii]